MSNVIPQRMTARIEGDDFVVFLIGARMNRPWKVASWLPVVTAMPRMLRELASQPELGYLGGESYFGRTSLMVQYWKSLPLLLAYAHAQEAAHLPAWREFNKKVGTNGDVGIWHETYVIKPGTYENIYVNMPPFGLGLAGRLEQVGKRRKQSTEQAAERIEANRPGSAP